jgi:hypothetical protein
MNADRTHTSIQDSQSAGARRSRQSLEFEEFWRSLPKQALLPHRRDFNPARAASLLRSVMLIELRLGGNTSLPVRLVGSAISERIQRDITAHDYLEFLPPELRPGAIETARLMLNHPCGLWQVTPLHYERGLAENYEMTAFPLLGEPVPFLIGVVIPRSELVRPVSPGNRAVLAGTATEFEFLDVGAGIPAWPPDATAL